MNIEPIAVIYTDFSEKFGIPRQSGLVKQLTGKIVFEKKYRDVLAIQGLEEFSHVWLIWEFSKSNVNPEKFVPMVHPPKLGGTTKKGVFATRSPFRPNRLGLSSVEILQIDTTSDQAPVIYVSGIDILNGTPIYDIKPYIPYADAHVDAKEGYTVSTKDTRIDVVFEKDFSDIISEETKQTLTEVLRQDPRAAYNKKEDYIYGMAFRECDVRFKVEDNILKVVDICYRDDNFKEIK
ncbi:tRNA (N6-threonylcarbamoyladenosine(37)-N6)-methyltransferase TrmO [Lachnobacterium bovis]|uniref:tRNA-Thr(GGU) m(6)t(6)A37 methyltransferase TsaA n=1 Tax=Lachnobacterium bovis TaxID=140626 RepID=A0A1H9UGB6_9FIRM|nr:tRNA (N6-threonylcarbamoyladenosine(37)-N6)-methyltransferase TrmO [Lachnobacterium bovis]SES08486.1 tRNA-Thr(GGU) m(6)t(6)A37 methyltransferase TsaA [Lachnobacterium bovis]